MQSQKHMAAIKCIKGMYASKRMPATTDLGGDDTDNAYVDVDRMVTVVMRDLNDDGTTTESRYMFPAGWFAGNDDSNSQPWCEQVRQSDGIIIDERRERLTRENQLPVAVA